MVGRAFSEPVLRCLPFKKGLLGAMAGRAFSDAVLRYFRYDHKKG